MMKCFKKYALLLWCLLISIVVLGICSKSSPLYPMNDWVDVHCFFTIGRALLDGQVLYTELYEQKGPVLYFLYALVSFLSDSSFLAVFALEVCSFTLFLYYSAKMVALYTNSQLFPYLSPAILAVVIGTCPALAHGGSVEQLCLGLMVYGLYSFFRSVKDRRPFTFSEALVNGIFAGMILWIKFTMLGFYVGLCLSVVLFYLVSLKSFRKLLSTVGAFLLGVGAVTAVVLLYFVFTGALKDLYTAYFYNNLFLYPSDSETSKLNQIFDCVKWALHYNPGFAILLYLGLGFLINRLPKSPIELVCGLTSFAGLAVLTYWGGKGIMHGYGYYDLVLSLFAVFGLCGLGYVLSKISLPQLILNYQKFLVPLTLAVSLVLSASVCLSQGRNTYLMAYEKEDMPQYQFAEIINQVEDPTLLNYGFLDGGFYYAAGVHPNCRFFCTFNVSAPDMWETQWEGLWAGEFDFVVTRQYTLPSTFSNYQLVFVSEMMFEGIDFTYYLYQLKE